MKMLLVGNFLRGSLEFSYERALKALGVEACRFDLGLCNRILMPFWERLVNNNILRAADKVKPQLILVMKGYPLWPETIKIIREKKKILTFCFMGDDPFNLTRGVSSRNVIGAIPHYDCYFIWTKTLIDALLKSGAKRVEYLPFGFDAEQHQPMELTDYEKKLFANDIVFVGSWDKEREVWLKELISFDLGVWGEPYWRRRCNDKALRKKWRLRPLYGLDMSRALVASKICINILRIQNKNNYNMRTFEIPASGGFMLSERSAEAQGLFEEDKEAVYFSTSEELKEKIKYYLAHADMRTMIATAGYRRCIRSDYAYLHRVKRLLEVYRES